MKKTLTTLALSVIWSIALAYQGADKDNPSLRQALQDFGIPQSMAHAEDLDFRVSSGTAFNADCKKATQASDKPAPACDSAATLFACLGLRPFTSRFIENYFSNPKFAMLIANVLLRSLARRH